MKVNYVKLKERRGGMDKMGLKQALKTKLGIPSLPSLEELGLMLTFPTRLLGAGIDLQRMSWVAPNYA